MPRVETIEDYFNAVALATALMGAQPGTPEEIELEHVIERLEDYEDRIYTRKC